MKLSIGCRVRFLNEVGGGQVVKFIDKRMALVKTDDGFEIPTLISELVVVEPSSEQSLVGQCKKIDEDEPFHSSSQKTKSFKEEIDITIHEKEGDELSLHLAFVPENIQALGNTSYDFYLINDSTYKIFYVISRVENELHNPIASSLLLADTKILIKQFNAEEINQMICLNIQAIYHKGIPYKPYQPEFYDIEINPIKLQKRGNFTPNDFFDSDAYIISIASTLREAMVMHLTDRVIAQAIREKGKPTKLMPFKPAESEMEEVDLHIHQLINDWQGLTPSEILKIQLARFETAIEGGIKSKHTKRMVFIHGVGNGKLKYEIQKILNSRYPRLRYQDASFKEYGFGATLVFIK